MNKRSSAVIFMALLAVIVLTGQAISQEAPNDSIKTNPAASASVSEVKTFFDGDFDAGWIDISGVTDDPQVAGAGPGDSSFDGSSVEATGGSPGAFRETSHTITYGDRIYSGGLNTKAVYDPSVSGPIATIDFSSDLRHPISTGNSAWVLLIEQDDTMYFSSRVAFSNWTWQSFQVGGLTAADFESSEPGLHSNYAHPDFSGNGAPITFGYVFTNSMLDSGTITNNHGIDNWAITVRQMQLFLPVIVRASENQSPSDAQETNES